MRQMALGHVAIRHMPMYRPHVHETRSCGAHDRGARSFRAHVHGTRSYKAHAHGPQGAWPRIRMQRRETAWAYRIMLYGAMQRLHMESRYDVSVWRAGTLTLVIVR